MRDLMKFLWARVRSYMRLSTTFSQVVRECDSVGIQVLMANPPTPLCEALNRYGFFGRYSSERLFPSVAIAVRYTRDGNRVVRCHHVSPSLLPLISLPSFPGAFDNSLEFVAHSFSSA